MRNALIALATLFCFAGVGRTVWAQNDLSSSGQCQCQQCQQARAAAAAAQGQGPVQPAGMYASQPMPSGVQQAGFGHHLGYSMGAAGCYPGSPCYGGGYGYPGNHFNGGHYGPFGGAHRTPGYPHHHNPPSIGR
jgi:hypothetical protein